MSRGKSEIVAPRLISRHLPQVFFPFPPSYVYYPDL